MSGETSKLTSLPEEDDQKGSTYSPQGDLQNDSLEKEYNDRLVQLIRPDFVMSVDPKSLIFFLPPGSLAPCEEEMVLAELSIKGPRSASKLLLKLLSRHKNWVQNLSVGLRHDGVRLGHLAEKLEQHKTLSGQSRREDITYWRQINRQQYPKLTQGTHFVPPLHFPRGDFAGSIIHRFPSILTSTPSGTKFIKPSEKKFPYTYEERMLTSSVPESGVLDGQQRFLYGLHDLAEKAQEVVMVVSQIKFGQYVNKPSYAAAADTFLGQSANIKERRPGETDVLIIKKQYGLITGEIRDVQMTEHEKDVNILATIQEAITKLNESEGVLKQLVSFMLDVNVTKTLILPSVTSDQLSRVLSEDVKTQEDLCRCLGVKTLTEALELCLLAEGTAPSMSKLKAKPGSLTQMESWWLRLLKQTRYKVDMMDSEYEHLVAMFCDPDSTMQFHSVSPVRLELETGTPFDPYTEYTLTKSVDLTSYSQFDPKTQTHTGKQSYIDRPVVRKEPDTNSFTGTKPYTDIREQSFTYISEKPYTDTGEKTYTDTSEKPYKDTLEKKYTGTSKGKDTHGLGLYIKFPLQAIDSDFTKSVHSEEMHYYPESFSSETVSHPEPDSSEIDIHPELVTSETVSHPEPVSSETVNHPEPVSSETGNTSDPMIGESPSVKPIFSETWQMCQTFTSSTGQMQGKDSDIVLFVPEGAIEQQDEVIVHGAVCTDLKIVHQELRLEDSETIVSPVVEYHTDHLGEFQKPVNIYLPLFIPSTSSPAESLRVYRFFKSENGSVDKELLRYKTLEEEKTAGKNGKENERFFYLTETRQICVVALHFCGFVCTCCNMEIKPGPLCLRLYGVHRQRKQREAIISLYVWDERLAITDFEKKHVCGQEQDLKFIIEDSLDPVPSDANLDFGACLELTEEDEEIWKHREKKTGFQMLPSEARRTLQSMFVCSPTGVILSDDAEHTQSKQGNFNTNRCYERKPVRIHWSLENKPGYKPDTWFRCAVQAGYVKGDKHMQFLEIPQSRTLSVFGLELEKQPNANAGIQTEPDPCSMTHVKELNSRQTYPIIEPTDVPTPNAVSTQVHSNTIPNVESMPLNFVNDLLVDAASGFQTTATNHSHSTNKSVIINNYVTTKIEKVKGYVDLACNRTSETSSARDSPRGLCGPSSPVVSEAAAYSLQEDLQVDRLEKEYDRLVQLIRPDFVQLVDPNSLICFLPPGSLSESEEQEVEAVLDRKGPRSASKLLLKFLSKHENWVQNLLVGLRHDEIRLEHLAEKLEQHVNLTHS